MNLEDLKIDGAKFIVETVHLAYSEPKVLNGSEIYEKASNFVWQTFRIIDFRLLS